jgi:two-component system CheB/CheR fusion protein
MTTKNKKSMPAKKAALKTKKSEKETNDTKTVPIVGIGASAGGLETLKALFAHMPPDSDMAFVIIQHLRPRYKSSMAEIIGKDTQMRVTQIEDGIEVEPNCIYLNPPDKNVSIFNGRLQLMAPLKEHAVNMPIDFFFRSLAEDQKEKAIGIIVSGTASDGTLGTKGIKGEGGMIMAQDPNSARYDGMPLSAINTGLVDFVLPVNEMPKALIDYVRHPTLEALGKEQAAETKFQNQLQKIFNLIRSTTGHDFSQYKQSTIQRRLERRLAVHQITTLSNYILFLQKNPAEIEVLFKNLIIGVTRFFRDPETYEILKKKVLPALLGAKGADAAVRCWVVGCSTGEEVYSLAMVISEVLDKLKKQLDVQIFATDIDPAAIEVARTGFYPESIGADVSKKRLNQYFTKTPDTGGYKIKKQIRDMVIFSEQNIIKDPPFSRLDLVSCRNLMIYLAASLQKKIIPLFHYTLNPKGLLLLGTSESIGGFTDLFEAENFKLKIFRRKTGLAQHPIEYEVISPYGQPRKTATEETIPVPAAVDVQAIAQKVILDVFAPCGVLIDGDRMILHFVGNTEPFLGPPKGRPSFDLLDMACKELKYHLTTIVHKALREKEHQVARQVRFHKNDQDLVDISVTPISDQNLPPGLWMVVFEKKSPHRAPDEDVGDICETEKRDSEVQRLEDELQTTNEELKSINEEMQSVNEELQSTNEELETSKEELQSTNEELTTVNVELQKKVDELSKASADMDNLLAASEIASIFLDIRLCIKRYTPRASAIVKLIATDIGRPLSDLNTNFKDIDLAVLAEKVLKDLNTIEMEAMCLEKIWYAIKITPYRTVENVIDGVVISFVDIQHIKRTDDKIRWLATVVQDSNDAVTVQDFSGKILSWNRGAEQIYGWAESEALAMNISQLIPEDKRKEEQAMIKQLKQGFNVKPFKTRRISKDGEILDIWLTATVLRNERRNPEGLATTERDLAWLPQG